MTLWIIKHEDGDVVVHDDDSDSVKEVIDRAWNRLRDDTEDTT